MITGVIQRMLKVLGVLGLLWSWQGTECYVLVSCLRPLHGIMNNKILFIMLSSGFGWLCQAVVLCFLPWPQQIEIIYDCIYSLYYLGHQPPWYYTALDQNPSYITYKVLIRPLTSAERHHTSCTQKQMCLIVSMIFKHSFKYYCHC